MSESLMTTAADLNGFSKESRGLIREMESYGWQFRVTNHGARGHGPNGRDTLMVSRNLSRGHGKNARNARTEWQRWLRKEHAHQVEEQEPAVSPEEAGMALSEALARFNSRGVGQTVTPPVVVPAVVPPKRKKPGKTIVSKEPFRSTQGGRKYTSAAIVTRTWSNGSVDYICAMECGYNSANYKAVGIHYGKAHTMKGTGTSSKAAAAATIERVNPRPEVVREEYAKAIEEVQVVSEPELVAEVAPVIPLPSTEKIQPLDEVIRGIRALIAADLVAEIDRLQGLVDDLTTEVAGVTAERDALRESLSRTHTEIAAVADLVQSLRAETD